MTRPLPGPNMPMPGPDAAPLPKPAPDMVAAMVSPLRWHVTTDLPVAKRVLDGIIPVTPETTGSADDPVACALHTLSQLTDGQRAEVLAYYQPACACCFVAGHTRRCGATATTTVDVPPFGSLDVAEACKARINGGAS